MNISISSVFTNLHARMINYTHLRQRQLPPFVREHPRFPSLRLCPRIFSQSAGCLTSIIIIIDVVTIIIIITIKHHQHYPFPFSPTPSWLSKILTPGRLRGHRRMHKWRTQLQPPMHQHRLTLIKTLKPCSFVRTSGAQEYLILNFNFRPSSVGSAYCECPDGFDIGDDNQTCHDINEVDSDYDSGLEIHYREFYRSFLISS